MNYFDCHISLKSNRPSKSTMCAEKEYRGHVLSALLGAILQVGTEFFPKLEIVRVTVSLGSMLVQYCLKRQTTIYDPDLDCPNEDI